VLVKPGYLNFGNTVCPCSTFFKFLLSIDTVKGFSQYLFLSTIKKHILPNFRQILNKFPRNFVDKFVYEPKIATTAYVWQSSGAFTVGFTYDSLLSGFTRNSDIADTLRVTGTLRILEVMYINYLQLDNIKCTDLNNVGL